MEIENFAKWIVQELDQRGWTQADLSRRSGISPAQITRLLSGERGVGEKTIIAIARAFKLPNEFALRAAGLLPPSSPQTENQEQLNYLFGCLPDEGKKMLVEYARFLLSQYEQKK